MVKEAPGAELWDWPRRDQDQRSNLPRRQMSPTLTDREVAPGSEDAVWADNGEGAAQTMG